MSSRKYMKYWGLVTKLWKMPTSKALKESVREKEDELPRGVIEDHVRGQGKAVHGKESAVKCQLHSWVVAKNLNWDRPT